MYSVILLAAMTTPAEAPSFGKMFKGGCGGVSTACGGYAGYSSASGYGSRGGCGGCWSTGGYKVHNACHGAGACYGYAYAGAGFGFAGCYGSCYGSHTNYFSYWQPPMDGHQGWGVAPMVNPMPVPLAPIELQAKPLGTDSPRALPLNPANPPKPITPPKPGDPAKPISAAATVIVSLPSDAILLANGTMTRQISAERKFTTPELETGNVYHYTFTAEVVVGGKTVTETQHVEVIAGHESRVAFQKLFAATKADPAQIAGR